MNAPLQTQAKVTPASPAAFSVAPSGLLQRKCACGGAPGVDGECAACRQKRLQRKSPGQSLDPATRAFMEPHFGHDLSRIPTYSPAIGAIQTKLAINKPGDACELEADRIANQVISASGHMPVGNVPSRIQRYAEQASEGSDTAPASVDRAVAGSGTPLEPALRQDMEQGFGHDFSQVRVHTSASGPGHNSGSTRLHDEARPDPIMELHPRTERFILTATVRQPALTRDADGPIDDQEMVPSRPPESPSMIGEEMADGETADLSVYVSSYPPDGEADAISANFTYSPTVAVSPDEPKDPSDFGTTWGNHVSTTGGKIHKEPGRFEVTLTYENPIVIRVFKDTGPRSQTNIESETDPDIKAGNYTAVVTDLTPGKDDRSPRNKFWARDLTLIHERFHATDGQQFCKKAVEDAKTTLESQTASSKDEVNELLKPIPNKIVKARAAGMSKPASEDRAYKDGAPKYKDRADKIAALGKAGKYTAALEPMEPEGPDDTRLAETAEVESSRA